MPTVGQKSEMIMDEEECPDDKCTGDAVLAAVPRWPDRR
jgi:hypothetical protein